MDRYVEPIVFGLLVASLVIYPDPLRAVIGPTATAIVIVVYAAIWAVTLVRTVRG